MKDKSKDNIRKTSDDKDAEMVKKLTLIRKNIDAQKAKKKRTKS